MALPFSALAAATLLMGATLVSGLPVQADGRPVVIGKYFTDLGLCPPSHNQASNAVNRIHREAPQPTPVRVYDERQGTLVTLYHKTAPRNRIIRESGNYPDWRGRCS